MRQLTCGVGAAYEFEGRHYCKTHHPPTAQARADARKKVLAAEGEALRKSFVAAAKAREDAKADNAALRAFAHACMAAWPITGLDGAYLQDLAVKHGLLAEVTATEPCSDEGCFCADYNDPTDFATGVECFRKTQRLLDCAPSKEQP